MSRDANRLHSDSESTFTNQVNGLGFPVCYCAPTRAIGIRFHKYSCIIIKCLRGPQTSLSAPDI